MEFYDVNLCVCVCVIVCSRLGCFVSHPGEQCRRLLFSMKLWRRWWCRWRQQPLGFLSFRFDAQSKVSTAAAQRRPDLRCPSASSCESSIRLPLAISRAVPPFSFGGGGHHKLTLWVTGWILFIYLIWFIWFDFFFLSSFLPLNSWMTEFWVYEGKGSRFFLKESRYLFCILMNFQVWI